MGEVFNDDQTEKALESIYKYNFKENMRDFFNPCRLYSLNDEAGLVICDWPEGKQKPVVPLTYAEETMNGFEYQAAIHMIQEGLISEGLEIIEAIRDRYDGEKRNPWNEFECGSNYARSMASYALLPTFSGFQYDMTENMIGFAPINIQKNYSCFWSVDSGWGVFEKTEKHLKLKVLYGNIELKEMRLSFIEDEEIDDVSLGNNRIDYQVIKGNIKLSKSVKIREDDSLIIDLK